MLFNDADNPWDKLGKTIMGLSQTPQVYLDHQAGEMGGELVINWDYVSEIFDQDMINRKNEHWNYIINKNVDIIIRVLVDFNDLFCG